MLLLPMSRLHVCLKDLDEGIRRRDEADGQAEEIKSDASGRIMRREQERWRIQQTCSLHLALGSFRFAAQDYIGSHRKMN